MSGEVSASARTTVATTAPEIGVYRRSEANIRRLSEMLSEDLVADLAREVILRVASKESVSEQATRPVSDNEIRDLCHAFVSETGETAASIISDLVSGGVLPEEIYKERLSPAARMLGEMWVSDEVSFGQVTIGTGRMFSIMRSMRHLFEPTVTEEKSAIFAAVPGEDHTLGVHMAADIFRKDGWEIALKVGLDHDQLVSEVMQTPGSIVGLSISGEHSIDALSRLIVALHIECPTAILVVSGSNVEEVEPILSLMGLDGIATTLEDAQVQLATLWDRNIAR